jgi:hypothetical protein
VLKHQKKKNYISLNYFKAMNKSTLYGFFFLVCLLGLNSAYGQKTKQNITLFGKQISSEKINPENGIIRCGTTEYEEFLQENNPKRMTSSQFESWLSPLIQNKASMRTSQTNAIITIPVVVHVVYNGQVVGTAPNISDIQVESQITVLNQDFRRMVGTPGENFNPVGADTEIQFVLAKQDPNGNPTNGIDRVSFCKDSWTNFEIETTLKPSTIWDPTQYLNLWTVQFEDNDLLGYAQFPDGSGLNGIGSSGGSANTDGVVVRYNSFGSGSGSNFILNSPYNKGRTTTHEIGHWLGLIHIWGEGSNCSTNTDYCADTPVAKDPNYGCPTGTNSCTSRPGNDMIENYMDYTNDFCMSVFTQDQKTRMVTVMANSPRRSSLKTSSKGNALVLVANDAEVSFESSCATVTCTTNVNQFKQKIIIYNRGTNTLTSVSGSYMINGGSAIPFSWSGSLATNKFSFTEITINASVNGSVTINIDNANNVTDQRTSNNAATGSYSLPIALTNYAFTNYTFRLQQDYFGSETTWNLKNSAGTILHSGGPYTNTYVNDTTASPIPTLITQNWTLPSNQCYTFTINDSQGDGICCGTNLGESGTGYYDIKSTDGSVIVASGASFKSSQSKFFTTNTLSNEKFENSSEIFIFPNPTKDILVVNVPNHLGIPNSYIISSISGQIIINKEVLTTNDLNINTSSLSNGIYFITLEKGSEKKTLKFIKK